MPLTCECDGDYDWYYDAPDEYIELEANKSKKCCSCRHRINKGDTCIKFICYEIDENGDEQYKPSNYMCEECADIYYSLDELGFCITLGESMKELAKEYNEIYQPRKDHE